MSAALITALLTTSFAAPPPPPLQDAPAKEAPVEIDGPPPADRPVIRLWDGPAPASSDEDPDAASTLTVYRPDAANGTAVVVCPGGGYAVLATDHEGTEVAGWLNGLGITAFVLRYRVRPHRHPAPLLDAQRAVRVVRSGAKKYAVQPDRVGILGFSAGGHLASTAATHHDTPLEGADDLAATVSARPDFAVLVYPVVSFTDPATHRGSLRNLLGDDPDPALVRSLSNELAVTADTPPTFLVASVEDAGVPARNSILFHEACVARGVPSELHVFEAGPHGFGLATRRRGPSIWPTLCADWMRGHGWVGE